MAAKSNVIFNPSEIIEACEAAEAQGGDRPLSRVFEIDQVPRPGPNGTQYLGVTATTRTKKGRLLLRFTNEKHSSQIAPIDDIELARINAERGTKYGALEKRDRNPSITIQKYKTKIEVDDQGRPKSALPGLDQVSPYFRAIEYLDRFFYEEMTARKDAGKIVAYDPRQKLAPGAVAVSSVRIVPMFQAQVSRDSKKNAGMELANPLVRINMKFDKDTQMAKKTQFFDFDKPLVDPASGKKSYEPLTFDGHPITGHNVHKIISHSTVSGISNLNAVCCSNLGISIPSDIEVLIVELPKFNSVGIDDVFEDDDNDGAPMPPAAKPEPAAAPAPAPAPSPAPAKPAKAADAPALSEEDLAGVLNDLGVDN